MSHRNFITGEPPAKHYSIMPLLMLMHAEETAYYAGQQKAKQKYKPQLIASCARELRHDNLINSYNTGFNSGWNSADYAVVGPNQQKLFFNNKEDVGKHIWPEDKLERRDTWRPIKKGGLKPKQLITLLGQIKDQPETRIVTKDKINFTIFKREPNTGLRYNPPGPPIF